MAQFKLKKIEFFHEYNKTKYTQHTIISQIESGIILNCNNKHLISWIKYFKLLVNYIIYFLI